MKHLNVFVASSGSVADDRRHLEVFVSRLNDQLVGKDVYVQLVLWEKMPLAFSGSRKQDEFNRAIDSADLFLCLIFDRVGKFTQEEFAWAIERYRTTSRPRIVVLFKSAPVDPTTLTETFDTVLQARKTIEDLGQIWGVYANTAELQLRLEQELAPLIENAKESADSDDDVNHESNQVVIDIVDPEGRIAYLRRTTHVRMMKPTKWLFDRISADGYLVQESLAVCPGRIVRAAKEEHAWQIETELDQPLSPGEQILKTIAVEVRDGFLNSSEYWMDRQIGLRSLTSIEVRFPASRPPVSWHAQRVVKYKELNPSPYVYKYEFCGRTILQLQSSGKVPYEICFLRWEW